MSARPAGTVPRFSAVVPAYQAEATLASAIESVLAQTSQDFEVIVVDDGSTDATARIAASFEADSRIRTVAHPENRGLASARNTGIEHAAGEYIGFLDSDDLWMPEFLEAMGGALDREPEAGLAYTDGWVLDDSSRRIMRGTVMARQRPPMPPPREPEPFLRELVRRNFIVAETMVRKSALAVTGAFDPTLPAVEDYELWLRLLAFGFRAVRPPGLLLVRRDRPDSMSKDPLLMYEAHRRVWEIVISDHPAPESVKAIARRQIEAMDRLIAAQRDPEVRFPARHRARLAAGRAKRAILGSRRYHSSPPAEVAAAFDLERV